MTGTELAALARAALYLDVDSSNLRIDDPELIRWINDAQRELYRVNPSVAYVTSVTAVQPSDINALADTLGINDLYTSAIVDYLVYRFYSKDTQDEENRARATAFFNQFAAKSGARI